MPWAVGVWRNVFLLCAMSMSLLQGCTQNRLEVAAANARATKPLVEWIDVEPAHVAEMDPERLKGEGAALVIARSIRETAAGERSGTPDVVILRDISTSTMHETKVQRIGNESEVGWAVMLVPPGQYAVNRGATSRTIRLRGNTVASKTMVDTRGHPFVPLGATTRISAGDVVYVGTIVYQAQAGDQRTKVFVRDERSAAMAWVQSQLPRFAPMVQIRILPPPVQPLS